MEFLRLQEQFTYGSYTLTGVYKVIHKIKNNNKLQYVYVQCIDTYTEYLLPADAMFDKITGFDEEVFEYKNKLNK